MMDTDWKEHYRKLENAYHGAPCNKLYEPTLVVSKEKAEIRFSAKKEMLHAGHSLHGSIYFKALDDAAFFAANSLERECFLATSSFNIYFFRPVFEGEVLARGEVVQASPRLYVAESHLFHEGKIVAQGSGTFVPTSIELTPGVGYE